MRPSRGSEDDHVESDPDDPTGIPSLVRAWQSAPQVASSVRRPSTLPDPESYHKDIETEAIFELDEKQKNGSIETILVVALSCKRCKTLKQACSRTRPACVRCRKAGLSCEVIGEGYQRLKIGKNARMGKQGTHMSCEVSGASSDVQGLTAGQSLGRRTAPGTASSSLSKTPVASGAKRPLSPVSDYAPSRKKTQAGTTSRKAEMCRLKVVLPRVERSESSAQVAPADERRALAWSFVNVDEKSIQVREPVRSMPPNTLIPRAWTKSLEGLLTVFPELGKSKVRFSWFQSESPVLLLESNYAGGEWIGSTTLRIDMLWDFSCNESELEPVVESNTALQAETNPPLNSPDHDDKMMGLQSSYAPPVIGQLPMHLTTLSILPTRSTEMLSLDGALQDERFKFQGAGEFNGGTENPIDTPMQCDSDSEMSHWELMYPSSPVAPPPSHPPALNGSPARCAPPLPNLQPRIPLDKPPEVETLLNSHLHSVPLLLWIPHDSVLLPCILSSEYAYSCMGFFFISDLHHSVVEYNVPSITGVVQGRVRWSVTLQWAPGGEEALTARDPASPSDMAVHTPPVAAAADLSHPWWHDPTNATDNISTYRPRDLRMQFFSFIPLDLLAEFHPSESFPRGWFCKACGLINVQEFFRHQICRSSACESSRDKRVPAGKVDPLSSLRGYYQSSTLIHPKDNVPSVVVSGVVSWDDGMQSRNYDVKDGVTLCHIFTGNQGHLQEDATALLGKIQCEMLLRKEDSSSPYFIHNTEVSHPSDGSETMVPVGTPNCVRIAYHTLCDFVHRYGEMQKPRFGEVRILAWVNPGTRKGIVLRASKSPVVLHCLGAEVVIHITPKGGYKDSVKSPPLDKGKGRAEDEDRSGSPPRDPDIRSSRHLEPDNVDEMSFISRPEMDVVAETVVEATSAMDTVQDPGLDAGGVGAPDLNAPICDPGTEVADHKIAERASKKNKVTKDKNKASIPKISMTLVHGDCAILSGDDFEHQIVRTGTTILVIGFPEA